MSRPRRYWPVEAVNADGIDGWSLVGECIRTDCGRSDGHWGRPDCGHRDLLAGWWPTRELAVRQAELWRARQTLILTGDPLGPVPA